MPGARTPFESGSDEYGSGSNIKYPNPFFDLASQFVPSNIKTLFKYCRGFYYTNGFIRNIITKLTEYPITDILFDTKLDPGTKEKYTDALRHHLKIKQLLIEIGLDYYTFGNAFISANLRFKRYLQCTNQQCGKQFPIMNIEKSWKFKDFNFHGICPECMSENKPFKVADEYIKNIESFNFIRWAPEQIDIEYDDTTGESVYYYRLSGARKKKILSGNKEAVAKTPLLFLKSLKEKKLIQLDSNNLYHFKRPTLAEENMAWGKPAILPAIKDLYYMQTLQRGNEAVAHEHIVPKKAIYPSANGAIDPFQSMNLGKWRGQMEEQLLKWKRDPNHIAIFPIPVGFQELGGDAKMLLLHPELKFLEENVITNMGLPLDFIKGGASWTGSSISLRIVENHFLPYREMLEEFVNYFVIQKLTDRLGYPKVKIKFKELKMTDDSETKQIMLNMRETKQVSHKTLLDKFGLDYAKERANLRAEHSAAMEDARVESTTQATAQGLGQEILARHEARAMAASQDEQHRLREKPFEQDILAENKNVYMETSKLIDMLAIQMSLTPPEQQEAVYAELSKRAPLTAALVLERFLASQAPDPNAVEDPGAPMGPGAGAPTKGNKKENQVEPKGNKSKGATRGSA